MNKPEGYYNHARPEVMALVPDTARRILDVGCGTGALGAALKARQECYVAGIEQNSEAAETARDVLDYVRCADAETGQLPQEIIGGRFDCIVFADILEHLESPGDLLAYAREHWLSDDGVIVVSVPNARHWSVLEGLVNGDFSYTDAGLLDRDHLRMFTRRELQKLLWRAGFAQVSLTAITHSPNAPQGHLVRAGRFCFRARDAQEAAEFHHYQYLAVAKRRDLADHGTTSIIIPVCNQLPYTRQCLGLLEMTCPEAEIVVVDNGSTDGTREWLDEWQGGSDWRTALHNADNLGFARACNQGLADACGDNLVLLNNDTLPAEGWLDRLLDCLHSAPEVGLAGPVSNNVSGPQKVPVPYNTLGEVAGFSWDWGMAHAGERARLERLVGFCLAIKRKVYEKIGPLDERFGLGTFEDDDYCLRARQAGYTNMVARDCFMHHFGSMTFKGEGLDMAAMQAANQKLFEAKHGQ
ncbi:MAG TPA: glycosyltransferase [Anaerolineae bacterium]|nr:glycosyltransferase [Anaerolineae bacterium]